MMLVEVCEKQFYLRFLLCENFGTMYVTTSQNLKYAITKSDLDGIEIELIDEKNV